MVPDPALLARFHSDLDEWIPVGRRIGIAVSGGPDSLALLLLAAAARPGRIEAATVDHGLRADSRLEPEMVGRVCRDIGVPHAILTIDWADNPETAIQERAREERYRALGEWVSKQGLDVLSTAHHADDQAETLVMRLNRGSGVRGLACMRAVSRVPGSKIQLVRPLLGWRRAELKEVCAAAGLTPATDPSNADERFERVRVRRGLNQTGWLDSAAAARSVANLASADEALEWAARREWEGFVNEADGQIAYSPSSNPPLEILRRIVERALMTLAQEGSSEPLRGRELAGVIDALQSGRTATLRGVLCRGGSDWQFSKAPSRNRA